MKDFQNSIRDPYPKSMCGQRWRSIAQSSDGFGQVLQFNKSWNSGGRARNRDRRNIDQANYLFSDFNADFPISISSLNLCLRWAEPRGPVNLTTYSTASHAIPWTSGRHRDGRHRDQLNHVIVNIGKSS